MGRHIGPLHPRNQSNHGAIKKKLKAEFLEFFKQGGALYWAAGKIGYTSQTIEEWRKEDADFDLAIVEADKHVTDTLVLTAFQRALKGTSKHADALLMFLIKGREPRYKDRMDVDARHLHAGVMTTVAKVPKEVRELMKGLRKEFLQKLAEKL